MSTTGKRRADSIDSVNEGGPTKVPKLYSIFTKPDPSSTESTFRWDTPFGEKKTCLHGINLSPKISPKIAAFDLDGCLIESSFGFKAKGTQHSVKLWRNSVPTKLKEALSSGFSIVIITNQALRGQNAILEWKKKIPIFSKLLPDIPFHIFAAIAKDGYRKPIPGMWYELERLFSVENVSIDKSKSFFVGDAAGRSTDHAGTDRKWAENVNIPFLTPEEYFLKLPPAPYTLSGFNVSSLPDLPLYTPADTTLVRPANSSSEIMLFVGYPASGKSTLFRQHFEPEGYIHINQDTLRTRDKCVKAAEEAITQGHSCVIDNTNRDVATRKHYIDLAKRLKVPIRCAFFQGSVELAWHNNLYRAFNMPTQGPTKEAKRELLPYSVIASFKLQLEEPTLDEGFLEIKKVNWVFRGNQEERERWRMWLQIDGK